MRTPKAPGVEPRKDYVHMLNCTLSATQRTLCCVLENFQTPDGVRWGFIAVACSPYGNVACSVWLHSLIATSMANTLSVVLPKAAQEPDHCGVVSSKTIDI